MLAFMGKSLKPNDSFVNGTTDAVNLMLINYGN